MRFRRIQKRATDNTFVLDTILWKARAAQKKVHLAFLDISKAYDSVNRELLWRKLSSLGIGGEYLNTLKSLYTDDSVDCMVNGILTRPIFLSRLCTLPNSLCSVYQ